MVWLTGSTAIVPTSAVLARSFRKLALIERDPALLNRSVDDPTVWIEERRIRLTEAAYFTALAPANLELLVARADRGEQNAVEQLVKLLPAEALSRDELPHSPAAALAGCRIALPALISLVQNGRTPRLGRALAALIAGATSGSRDILREASAALPDYGLIQDAFTYGRTYGLPRHPALTLAALDSADGAMRAVRLDRAVAPAHSAQLTKADLQALRARQIVPAEIVALALAMEGVGAIKAWAVSFERSRHVTRQLATQVARPVDEVQALVVRVIELIRSCAITSGDAAVPPLATQLVLGLLALSPHALPLLTAAERVLQLAASLPGTQVAEFLNLLVELTGQLWNPASLPNHSAAANKLDAALQDIHTRQVEPAAELLRLSQDGAIVRAALARNVLRSLTFRPFREPEIYRWFLSQISRFPQFEANHVSLFAERVASFSSLKQVREAFDLFLAAVAQAPQRVRANLFYELTLYLERQPGLLARDLRQLARYVPLFSAVCDPEQAQVPAWLTSVVSGVLYLDRHEPERALGLIQALLGALKGWNCNWWDDWVQNALHCGILLAAMVGSDDQERFVAIVSAAVRHQLLRNYKWSIAGIRALHYAPALRRALGHLFVQQPRRLGTLIEQLGMASALGPDALKLLASLNFVPHGNRAGPALISDVPGWRDLLAIAPACADNAAAYLQACWVLGADPVLPPGVARALALPRRIADERDYVLGLVAAAPDRGDLAKRLHSLSNRLASPKELVDQAVTEATERLAQVTAELQITAAEQVLREIATQHLRALGVKVSRGAEITSNQMNAVLFWVSAGANRPLLRALLRAWGEGHTHWREELPENAAFLAKLEARGVDIRVWLGANRESFPLAGVIGGRVHLELEQDPLRVLQMGNYFSSCLSIGADAAFAAVANAVDLNKRVLYAIDGADRPIGRKLIALTDASQLVGFRTYLRCESDETADQLTTLIDDYLRRFAAHCGLECAEAGEVPTLVAAKWHNDGISSWAETLSEAASRP